MKIRPLYDCQHAIYPDGITQIYVWCAKGKRLGSGHITKADIDKDRPLVCRICQTCKDFHSMDDSGGDK